MNVPASDREAISDDDLQAWIAEHSGWTASKGRLVKEFRFDDFVEAFGFMARCACVFERLDHHPLWSNVFSRIKIELWTQMTSSITMRDLQVAEAVEALARPERAHSPAA